MTCQPKNHCAKEAENAIRYGPYVPCTGYLPASLGFIVPAFVHAMVGFGFLSTYKQFDSSSFVSAVFLFIFGSTICIPTLLFLWMFLKRKNKKLTFIIQIVLILYTIILLSVGIASLCFDKSHPTTLADVPFDKRHELEKSKGCCFVNKEIIDGEMIFIDCPLFDEMEKIDIYQNDCVKVDETYCCNTEKMEKQPPTCEHEILPYGGKTTAIGVIEILFVVYNVIGLIGWNIIEMKAIDLEKEEGQQLISDEEGNDVPVPESN
jgi:hypothetical protein